MKPQEILARHNLKRTSCREGIIHTIILANHALSEKEIQENLSGNYDRTTFYRSFKTLEEKNILHKIVIDNQNVKYALVNSFANNNPHAHFYCKQCDSVFCLETVLLTSPNLPGGYTGSEMEMIIKGQCENCNTITEQ